MIQVELKPKQYDTLLECIEISLKSIDRDIFNVESNLERFRLYELMEEIKDLKKAVAG